MSEKLPFHAEWMHAKNRRFAETIVFVHHFGGSRRTVLRHARLASDLGFDSVRFDLIFSQKRPQDQLPITGDLRFGVRHVWADQIESILNAIPGRKVLFTFSMPSSSALQAVARRRAQDIAGLICDGGPFLQLPRCIWNLYEQEYKVKSRVLRAGFTGASMLLWGIGFREQMRQTLKEIPSDFPVLSVRGWQDSLVPPSAIEEFFSLQDHLDLEVLSLPEAQHLKGLRDYPNEYVPRVESFLNRVATPVEARTETSAPHRRAKHP
ncbi:MAG: alpha/beta hydrolase [Bdellovibrionaceae bacterium]|nr:alpha/beta hydrolase [Pseudobdellovibrionaceae bacterium]